MPPDPIFLDGPMMAGYMATFMVTVAVAPLVLLTLAFPYAILRLRDAHNREPDPQLGFKAAQGYFFSLAVLLMLTGLTVIVVDLVLPLGVPGLHREIFPNREQRTGAALLVSGGLFALLHGLLSLAVRERQSPSPVRRVFLGCRFAVHGVVVMASLTVLMVGLFQRSDLDRMAHSGILMRNTLIGVLLVWAPSWLIHLILLRVASVPAYRGRRDRDWDSEGEWERDRDRDRGRERDWDRDRDRPRRD
jgi:hypothetical protein